MRKVLLVVCALAAVWLLRAQSNDKGAALRDAAMRGRADRVEELLAEGAPVDSADKNGRTALMLAAQRGMADVVPLLLAKGANANARDKTGFTAWALAMFDPSGKGQHHETIDALPQPPRPRVVINSGWTPVRLVSSCFLKPADLRGGVGRMRLDRMLLDQFEIFATVSGKHLMEIVDSQPRGMNTSLHADGVAPLEATDASAVINLQVQPGTGCVPPGDNLSLEIDVRVFRARDRGALFGKTFGGGVKALRAQQVDNPTQFVPVYEGWIKSSIEDIYWAVAESLYRADL